MVQYLSAYNITNQNTFEGWCVSFIDGGVGHWLHSFFTAGVSQDITGGVGAS